MRKRSTVYNLIKKLDGSERPVDLRKIDTYSVKVLNILDEITPRKLFRFRAVRDYNIDSFAKGYVFLNSPESFNDPTDCMLYVDPEQVMMSLLSDIPPDEYQMIKDKPIPNERLIKRLNAVNYGIDTIQRVREKVRIACFCESILSPLMWSHYAENHKGFALRYDMSKFTGCEDDSCSCSSLCHRAGFPFYPVFYKNTRSDTTGYACACALNEYMGFSAGEHPIPLLPLIQKGKDWSYEKEWRCICRNSEIEKMYFEPDAIYLGNQINDSDRKELIEIATSKGIEIYDMFIDYYDSKFIMESRPYNKEAEEDLSEVTYIPISELADYLQDNSFI